MKIREAIRATLVAAILLIPASSSWAQDQPIGDVARAAREERSQAQHAKKQITDDDIGPDRGPIHETDDPVTVVRDAWRAFLADAGHTCHGEFTNNSGPRWLETSLIEAQGPDRIHMAKHGGTAGDSEVISIGNDKYSRFGTQPWQKYTEYAPGEIPFARLAEIAYDSGLKLVRRETIEGSPTFLYESQYHAAGVSIRTDDIWIGANDHRLRKAQMLLTETHSITTLMTASGVTRYTITCSYGPVPEIKPPI
jgi:hypothetical protein